MKKTWPLLALALATGLTGIRWGLPSAQRLAVFPAGRPSPELAARLADAWHRLYAEIRRSHEMLEDEPVTYATGVVEVPPGWELPPDALTNSVRSMMLQSDHPDEKKSFIIMSSMRPWKLDFKPLYVFYGGAFIYPLGAFLKVCSWLGLAPGTSDLRHYLRFPEDMGRLYLWGRVFIALFHVGAVWLVFDLGRRLSGATTGAWAALLFALTPAAIVNSHLIKPHPFAAFWALAALRSLVAAQSSGASRDYLACGAAAGLAAGANFSAALVMALPAAAWLSRRRGLRAARHEARAAAGGLAAAAGVCVALNPYLITHFGDYAFDRRYVGYASGLHLASLPSLATAAVKGLGPIQAALAAAGAVLAVAVPGPRRVLGLTALLGFAALWARFGPLAVDVSLRLLYPVAILALVLGVDALLRSRVPKRLRFVLLAAALVDGALRSSVYLRNMRLHEGPRSTRARAAAWIEANVPRGATLGMSRLPQPAHAPALDYSRYRLVVFESPQSLGRRPPPEYLLVDRFGRGSLEDWIARSYEPAAEFAPEPLGWARLDDDSSFINGEMRVYRRRSGG